MLTPKESELAPGHSDPSNVGEGGAIKQIKLQSYLRFLLTQLHLRNTTNEDANVWKPLSRAEKVFNRHHLEKKRNRGWGKKQVHLKTWGRGRGKERGRQGIGGN